LKPIIGINTAVGDNPTTHETAERLYLSRKYVDSVVDAGGVPILIPLGTDLDQIKTMVDGWLIPGGDDIDPAHWNEALHPKSRLEPKERFELERTFLNKIDPGMPILGICYGCQFLNVSRQGSLIQHVPDVVGHEEHTGGTMQDYQIEPASRLESVVGASKARGKSYHHQSIANVGRNLRVVAKSEDGTIEAIEDDSGRWVLGVQWHPERTQDDPETKAIFRAFVAAAAKYREEKQACGTW